MSVILSQTSTCDLFKSELRPRSVNFKEVENRFFPLYAFKTVLVAGWLLLSSAFLTPAQVQAAQSSQLACGPQPRDELCGAARAQQQQNFLDNMLIGLSYLLPAGLFPGIFLYDKYSAYRNVLLKQQIELLEKLWHSDSASDISE